MKLRLSDPGKLVDLGGIAELAGISKEGNAIVIGAMTRHADVATSAEVKAAIPALADLAAHIGDRQVRAMGTLGGSVANNDPAACYPSAVLALGATVHTTKRKIAADDFFQGMFTTALADGELITAISFPMPKKAAYLKFKQPASRFALVGVFVAQTDSGVRVAVTGAAATACSATRGWKTRWARASPRPRRVGEDRCDRPEQRHPRLGGLPRQPDQRADAARGGPDPGLGRGRPSAKAPRWFRGAFFLVI